MTRGEITQLKGIWELCFLAWIMGFVALLAGGKVAVPEAIVFLVVEVLLIIAGHWIAHQGRKRGL